MFTELAIQAKDATEIWVIELDAVLLILVFQQYTESISSVACLMFMFVILILKYNSIQ